MTDTLSAELAEYEYQLEQISGALEADPANDELLTLKNELQDLITLTKSRQATTKAPEDQISSKLVAVGDGDKKRKLETHESRKVGDQVLAKWIGGDHQFYAARITSITGNQADPVYTVKFLEYNEVQTLHGYQLRNMNEFKKRGNESSSAAHSIPPPPPPGIATPKPGGDAQAPTKKKKNSSMKDDLAKSANDWTSFAKSGPKTTKKVGKRKVIGENSMFRTEDGGRVGVIGSGRAMTADPNKRARHVFDSDR